MSQQTFTDFLVQVLRAAWPAMAAALLLYPIMLKL